ncbi:MAG: Unknown protein [uncultured Aureispira sp.]|uniref:Uncharacterized protein n=1 Tax=uncultured Aureispira sp. TaxID=1331704 RepID=A0A6S6TAV9_9BACT|nr:MAG: Unknown protein [uncultured Aureispira sp.]
MKTKLVLWGTKGTEENAQKVLMALELNPETNKVKSWFFEGEEASEEFSKALMEQWRKGQAVAFPEGVVAQEAPLSASTGLVPEDIITDKTELLARTQTEWIFIVLSTKLYKNYQVELEELQEEVDALKSYSKDMWGRMKDFWAKVQMQIGEQNLFREHTNNLRGRTNEMFAQLKKMRSQEDAKFESEATDNYNKLVAILEPIELLIEKESADLQKAFDKLKTLQQNFKNAKLTRTLRSKLWDRIDDAFKKVKAKRSPNSSPEGRLTRRIEGLKVAIDKMEKSIGRDKKELSIQNDKINSGDVSQLETQLREVRAKLIRERIDSKSKKLEDMYNTMKDLEAKNARNLARKIKEDAAAAKKAEAAKVAAEKAAAETAKKEAAKAALEAAAPEAESPEVKVEAATEEVAPVEETLQEASPEVKVERPTEEASDDAVIGKDEEE